MKALSQAQQDALKEIGSIGAGHAANSLAALLQQPISLNVPNIDTPPVSSLLKMDLAKLVVAVEMGIEGDVDGRILVVFARDDALDLATSFVRKMTRIEHPSEADIDSTFQEFANIIAGSYVAALAQLTGLQLTLTTPTVVTGPLHRALAQFPSLEREHDILLIESQFVSDQRLVPGQIILVPAERSITSLLAPLEAKLKRALG
jgi:chemotaxis protein CheC